MNQTIHSHQVIHAFACRDGARAGRIPARTTRARWADARNAKRGRLLNVRTAATAAIVLVPLMAAEFMLGDIASDGWFAGVLNQTAQLLAIGSSF
jgi:hypothetical protein